MMRLLLDTHVFLWFVSGDPKLAFALRGAINNPQNGMLLLGAGAQNARADDGIFPPAPAAAPFINFDGKGFLLNGKRTFIASGGMEYCRVPRALWHDRLLRLKRAGFNCVGIYMKICKERGNDTFRGEHI